jgi:hypothetical protein
LTARPAVFSLSLVATTLIALSLWTSAAEAQELLSWWKRDLIEVDLTPGGWVTYASTEYSEGELYTDTLTVRVIAMDSLERRWVEVFDRGRPERELLLIDPADLRPDRSLLDALDRHLRLLPGGEVVEEDVDELRDSRLVQRHFQDLFQAPVVTRAALSDSILGGVDCARERIRLEERREEPAPVGSSILVTQIRSDAVVSPCVPIFSILQARTVTELSAEAAEKSGRPSRKIAPLRSLLEWHCIGFGSDGPTQLPAGVSAKD